MKLHGEMKVVNALEYDEDEDKYTLCLMQSVLMLIGS